MTSNPFWGESEKPVIHEWYHIKAYDDIMDKVITFWMWGSSDENIKEQVLAKKHYAHIEWIRQEEPPFSR